VKKTDKIGAHLPKL